MHVHVSLLICGPVYASSCAVLPPVQWALLAHSLAGKLNLTGIDGLFLNFEILILIL